MELRAGELRTGNFPLYHTLSSPFSAQKNPRTPFVCYLCQDCTYTSVFQKIFCSPLIRLYIRHRFAFKSAGFADFIFA